MNLLGIEITLDRRAFELRAALNLADETIALVGPSGAGKTSLLRSVAGLERPRAGHITLGDELWFDAATRTRLPPERRQVGYLPQDYGLFPHLTVAGNIRFAARRDRPELLERFGIRHLARARPGQLSGGERQRVALARALAREPRVLLLDEPFAALDTITRTQVRDELSDELRRLGLPTLLVTHAFEDATALAQRVGVIDKGRLLQLATPAELLARPADAIVAKLTGANVLDATATPIGSGSTLLLRGGGQLHSATVREGAVKIAIHSWQIKLSDPESSSLTDTVLSVRQDHGALLIRLARFTVRSPLTSRSAEITEGSLVGLSVTPDEVRILGPER